MQRRWSKLLFFGLLVVLFGIVVGGPLSDVSPNGAGETAGADSTLVTFVDSDGTELGTIDGLVVDTPDERFTGLSETDSLAPDEGMVFVYDGTATRHFVMRNMSFAIDIIFVDETGQITAIYHADVDDDRTFRATAQWVIEVNRGYTDTHNVSVGDEVQGLPR